MNTEVVLAALGIVATVVGGLIWVVKYSLRDLKQAIDRQAKAADRQAKSNNAVAEAVKSDTEISYELLVFMKKLNGRLPKLVEEKQAEAKKHETSL